MKYIITLVLYASLSMFSTASADVEDICQSLSEAAGMMAVAHRRDSLWPQIEQLNRELQRDLRRNSGAEGEALADFMLRVEREAKRVKPGRELEFKDRMEGECKILLWGMLTR